MLFRPLGSRPAMTSPCSVPSARPASSTIPPPWPRRPHRLRNHPVGFLGLSPRARGKRPCRRSRWPTKWVYPRECRGTEGAIGIGGGIEGLSPRARGNGSGGRLRSCRTGSIPASAGERWHAHRWAWKCRVCPRERGGTPGARYEMAAIWGLSPRARGNGTN